MLSKQHHDGPVPGQFLGSSQYKELATKNTFLSIEPGYNCINIDGRVACIRNIVMRDTEVLVVYAKFHLEQSLFNCLCSSQQLGIRIVVDLSETIYVAPLSRMQGKNVLLPYKDDQSVALPLLYTVCSESV